MKRFSILALAVAVGGAGAYGIVQAIYRLSPVSVVNSDPKIEVAYADLISILLTGISLILAALAFVIAILAIVGWNSIGDRVSSLAKTSLQEAMKDGGSLHELVKLEAQSTTNRNVQASMREGGELHNLVKKESKAIIYRGVEPVDLEFAEVSKEDDHRDT